MKANFVRATPMGLVFDEKAKPTFQQWSDLGESLSRAENCIGFAIGDWINYGQKKWGEKYREAVRLTGLDHGTLQNYASVAGSIEISHRNEKLRFAHHIAVAKLKPEEQKKWLDKCASEMENGGYVGKRRLARSIEAGELIAPSSLAKPSPDKGFTTHIQQITRLAAFWRDLKDSGRELTDDDRARLRMDFKPLEKLRDEMTEAGCWPSEVEMAATV